MVKPVKNKTKRKSQNTLSYRAWGVAKRGLLGSLPYILSLVLLGILFGAVTAYAVNSPAFQLQEVKILNAGSVTQDQAFRFCELQRGENLVLLDIVAVQQVIKRKYPQFKEVVVKRVLPNRVEVLLKRRTPVAQVLGSKYVQIDRDLVLLPAVSPSPFKNLTVIQGAPSQTMIVGSTIRDERTRKALKLKEFIDRANIFNKHELTRIDISDPQNISLFIDGDIEIRMGNEHLVERLKVLDQTLKNIQLDRSKIKYIDLRFDDVVVSPR